jgi:Cys-tRNA(Pro)/Cys-tRNA(Cys) deacylase
MAKVKKTNVMRILDKHKIMYDTKTYAYTEDDLSGIHAAAELGLDAARLFKTLIGKGNRTGIVVFCIPSDRELDLKKAAAVSGNKHVELLHVKDLPDITGYIRGGCSPIGMKKQFPTYIDTSAKDFNTISISAGQRGQQVLLPADSICAVTGAQIASLTLNHADSTGGSIR